MAQVEFGGTAKFDVFSGPIEVPDGVNPREWAATPDGREAIFNAFQEYWENTGIKLRDSHLTIDEHGPVPENSGESVEPWDEVIEL